MPNTEVGTAGAALGFVAGAVFGLGLVAVAAADAKKKESTQQY